MKMLPLKRPLLHNRWLKVLIAANTTLLLTTVTSVAEAATINFKGSVTSISSQRFPSVPVGTVDTYGEPLTTINTHKPVTAQDTIVGSYTFGEMDELLSARFRFVAPDSAASLDPSETDPLDIVFEPLSDIAANWSKAQIPGVIKRTTTASGSDTSASYERTILDLNILITTANTFSVNASKFSYEEMAARTFFYADQVSGNIDLYRLVDGSGSRPEPTDVPEPKAVLGLLMFAGVGMALSRRDRRLSTSPTSAKRV